MAREIFPTPPTPPSVLKGEIARYAANNNLTECSAAHSVAFLHALCRAFEAQVTAYYHAGTTAQDRLARLSEISQMFRETRFVDGKRVFTTAASNASLSAEEAYAQNAGDCPPGFRCSDRQCVLDL